MRLVFTKLETPNKNILVDLGTGTFEEFSLQELEDSETGKYLQIPDTIPANSIRVKVSSSEFENFDMIKDYQITDDEGNILGGGASGGKVTLYCHFQNEDPAKYYLTQDPIANVGKEQTLISIVGTNINTLTVTVTAATEDYSKITTENGSTLTLIRSSSGDITFDCGGSGGGSGSSEIDIMEVEFSLVQYDSSNYYLRYRYDGNDNAQGFISEFENYLYYLSDIPGVGNGHYNLSQYVAEQIARSADGTILYLKAPAYTGYGYTPVPYRIKIVG